MAEELWPFSLRVYAAPGVQQACLTVQDEHGGDVNIALCLLWHGALGHRLAPASVQVLDAAVAPWREAAVVPLRTLRRRLKAEPILGDPEAQEAFRTTLKKLELDAEKLEQRRLAAVPLDWEDAPPETAARSNLAHYGAKLGGLPGDLVALLVRSAVP